MAAVKLITTADGSHSLYHEDLGETYHSVHGAIQESRHVFIAHGFTHWVQRHGAVPLSLLEIGFGTGLNALLTLQQSMTTGVPTTYHAIEPHPLERSVWSALNYTDVLELQDQFRLLHQAEWNTTVAITAQFLLEKLRTTLQAVTLLPASYDLIYFDAFAPNKQPEMWTVPLLEKVVSAIATGGMLVTYCAKGQLKRDLRDLGLSVETLHGPPGKKEMIRGVKV